MIRKFVLVGALIALVVGFPPAALAYVGPGAGLGVLSALFAILAATVVTILGLLLWPLRAILRLRRGGVPQTQAGRCPCPQKPEESAQRKLRLRPLPRLKALSCAAARGIAVARKESSLRGPAAPRRTG